MTQMTKSRSYSQQQLKLICDNLCDNIESLFDTFNLEYRQNNKMYTMSCPIHGGDNGSAFNLYHLGDHYRGNWTCRTHGCEKVFQPSIIGLIRGLISVDKYNWTQPGDEICPFNKAVEFALGFLNKNLKDFKVSKNLQEKNKFTQIVENITKDTDENIQTIDRRYVLAALQIPAQYYIERGYSSSILKKYDIGLCYKQGKEMSNRIVAPIYDHNHQFVVGCTGRSIYEKCSTCGAFHNTNNNCPDTNEAWKYSKWKHSSGFKSQNHLYNFWYAKDHILSTNTVVIVESPGNVWRLEENNIHNSVAIFGCSLSDRQKIILDASGAMNMIILTDNDDAGMKAAEQIKKKCEKTYRIFTPKISKSDIGEMNNDEITLEIKQYMENII
jgi:5S rRNA maturation endonuclease (ribonuclease M5)